MCITNKYSSCFLVFLHIEQNARYIHLIRTIVSNLQKRMKLYIVHSICTQSWSQRSKKKLSLSMLCVAADVIYFRLMMDYMYDFWLMRPREAFASLTMKVAYKRIWHWRFYHVQRHPLRWKSGLLINCKTTVWRYILLL